MYRFLIFALFFISAFSFAADKPNILWLTSEDNNIRWIGCYGNELAKTPTIEGHAADGFMYTHCYASAPVCAPSRSTWITGINAASMGTQHMRSRHPIPHNKIKYYPDLLKAAGYSVHNHTKTDYNIGGRDDKSPWDSNGRYAWTKVKDKPWFQIINFTNSHESRLHGPMRPHPDFPVDKMDFSK